MDRERVKNKQNTRASIHLNYIYFSPYERGSTQHLFKTLTNCISNRASLTLTMNFPWKLNANTFEVPLFPSEWPCRGSNSNLMRWSVLSVYSNLFNKQRIKWRLDWSGIVPSRRILFACKRSFIFWALVLSPLVPQEYSPDRLREKRQSWIVPWKRVRKR